MWINTIPITDEMIRLANIDSNYLKISVGNKTRNASNKRDITGSLAHQAVEIKFEELRVPYTSYRLERLVTGDRGDIKYENDLIDVKGTKNVFNGQFLVFDSELEAIKDKGITHFCFVHVDYDNEVANIYGVISLDDFIENSYPVKLTWDNHAIRTDKLQSFIDYVNHS